jgi:hypothetical protein
MKKTQRSQIVKFDKTELVKSIIYKLEDNDDTTFTPQYFTLTGLRFYVVETIWDSWFEVMDEDEEQCFSKSEIIGSDECLFAYLDDWNYKITRITIQDIK